MPLKRVYLPVTNKSNIEEILGTKILLRNAFDINQLEIQSLVEQGAKNAMIYLDRNRLGQRLSIFEENKVFQSVVDLGNFLEMKKTPKRVECYDISHLQGKFVYGSMVTFIEGRPATKYYRLFKCKEQNNDFENHAEVMRRRLKRGLEFENGESDDKGWKLPDLMIIDGGKGQLSSDYQVLEEFGLQHRIMMVSIAKKEEEIFVPKNYAELYTNKIYGSQGGWLMDGAVKFFCQRIRDEAHRFAITNNRNARIKSIIKTSLDDIDGIGEVTIAKILKAFGSVTNLVNNLYDNPQLVRETIGKSAFERLNNHFGV